MMVLIAVCGISGAGKSTLIDFATENLTGISNMIPVTNRPPRPEERNGVNRTFLDSQQMQKLKQRNLLCLLNEVYCYLYGYFLQDFQKNTSQFIEIHHKYLHQLDHLCSRYISICIEPSNVCIAKDFLLQRPSSGNESNIRIQQIDTDKEEIEQLKVVGQFDYVFINDYTEQAKERFLELVKFILESSYYE